MAKSPVRCFAGHPVARQETHEYKEMSLIPFGADAQRASGLSAGPPNETGYSQPRSPCGGMSWHQTGLMSGVRKAQRRSTISHVTGTSNRRPGQSFGGRKNIVYQPVTISNPDEDESASYQS